MLCIIQTIKTNITNWDSLMNDESQEVPGLTYTS